MRRVRLPDAYLLTLFLFSALSPAAFDQGNVAALHLNVGAHF